MLFNFFADLTNLANEIYLKAIGKKMRSLRMTEKALAKPDQLV